MTALAVSFGLLVCAIIVAADFGLLDFVRRMHDVPIADKLTHFLLYGLLNLLVVLAVHENGPAPASAHVASGSSLLLGAAAAIEEISQRYIAGRMFSAWDLAAGPAGIPAFGILGAGMGRGVGRNARPIKDRRA
ncbi:MAG: VanZ family protein [Chloroflexota bacterium]